MAKVKVVANKIKCTSLNEAQNLIGKIGIAQRAHQRLSTLMNDEISKVVEKYKDQMHSLDVEVVDMQDSVKAYCEANRNDLTKGGKVKTCDLQTGRVSWRQRPPSVRVTKVAVVLESLKKLGLTQFIRVKEEVNKEAVLADPDTAGAVTGISVTTGVEDFVIEPFEVESTK